MQAQTVLIYQDYIHNNGQLYAALARHYGHKAVGYCDDADILSGCLNPAIQLFVMPGGADLYYCEKLNGAGNARIRAYVEQGGSYLGVCAGAYYGCAALDWAANSVAPINGARELGFYDGVASGPLPDLMEDGTIEKSWRGVAALAYDDGAARIETAALYEGGPVFTGGSATILARYADGRAAIVECRTGKGKAILSGPHIEIMTPPLYAHRNESFAYEKKITAALAPHLATRQALWAAVLDRLTPAREVSDAA